MFEGIPISPTKMLSYLWQRFLYGGERSLRPYEVQIINASFESESISLTVGEQLTQPWRIKRFHDDRVCDIYFYFPETVPRLSVPPDHQLAKLRLKNGRLRVDCTVATCDGMIRSLRFSKPPKEVVSGDFEISVLSFGGSFDDKVAKGIDFEEHGGRHDRP